MVYKAFLWADIGQSTNHGEPSQKLPSDFGSGLVFKHAHARLKFNWKSKLRHRMPLSFKSQCGFLRCCRRWLDGYIGPQVPRSRCWSAQCIHVELFIRRRCFRLSHSRHCHRKLRAEILFPLLKHYGFNHDSGCLQIRHRRREGGRWRTRIRVTEQ